MQNPYIQLHGWEKKTEYLTNLLVMKFQVFIFGSALCLQQVRFKLCFLPKQIEV